MDLPSILHAILTILPIALLCCLPYFVGKILGSLFFGGEGKRIQDCKKRCEGLRSKLAKAQQHHREAEAEVSRLAGNR